MKEETAPAGAVGYRLARQRTLAGLSEQRLAACARVSASLISQFEQGVMPASPSFTAAVARALGIDVETLYGQPYGSAVTDPKADHAGVPALRAAVDSADDSVLPCPPMTAAELRARLNKCDRDRAHSRYAQMTAALPELLYHGLPVWLSRPRCAMCAAGRRPDAQVIRCAWRSPCTSTVSCACIGATTTGYCGSSLARMQ